MNEEKEISHLCKRWCCSHGRSGWGLFFIIVGLFLFAKELGFFAVDVSIWPAILIAFGAYLVFRK